MAIHDWSRIPAELFGHFHHHWSTEISAALNRGLLPTELSALIEERAGVYATRANRVVIRHHLGRIVAIIEIVSPGNKESRAALRDFVDKNIDFLRRGIHVLVIDLFPPTPRDPFGIHKAIWDEITEEEFVFPEGKNRILVSYDADAEKIAYIEPIGIGDVLPDMPLIINADLHVMVPLETTYNATWNACPEGYRIAVETGVMPNADVE